MADTRETILTAARATAQAHGYAGLSFRELAKTVGIRSASLHYHFPTKSDLAAELARRYGEDAARELTAIRASEADPAACLTRYVAIFRRALENGNRMCLCNFLAAEHDDLPEPVRAEVRAFADINIAWLAEVLDDETRAHAVFAAIGGAQLAARSRGDVTEYDRIVAAYRTAGLIPS